MIDIYISSQTQFVDLVIYKACTANTGVVLVYWNGHERNREISDVCSSSCGFMVGYRGNPIATSCRKHNLSAGKQESEKQDDFLYPHPEVSPGLHGFLSPPINEHLLSNLFKPCFLASTWSGQKLMTLVSS